MPLIVTWLYVITSNSFVAYVTVRTKNFIVFCVNTPLGYHRICACFRLFGIFWFRLAYFYALFGIFCSAGPGNPGLYIFSLLARFLLFCSIFRLFPFPCISARFSPGCNIFRILTEKFIVYMIGRITSTLTKLD